MERLRGKVAIVSGAARGMGASHARAIVAEGGRVVIGDVRDMEGAAFAGELGNGALFVHLDVTSLASWQDSVAAARETFGGLHVLVNNAGILNAGSVEDLPDR